MIERRDIEKYFTELTWIQEKDLRKKVIDVWKTAADRGGWNQLQEIPFTLLFEGSGLLVDHTKRITKLAWNVVNTRSENLNKDYLIAGALLHDVGKLLEYEMRAGKIVKSAYGEKTRHPAAGAQLAEECNLPKEVIHIIAAHSHEGDTMNRTPEAIIVHHCDFIDFEIKKRK
ncbi:MAG: HDIG domain-containing protein [Candidatus Thermoplasmatota archaeon]|jgi:putative nucleotidyltransferase with HDIG domain|nr:HDIG domain-containing protein [Candidatus Thermoplasmatota archaeon]